MGRGGSPSPHGGEDGREMILCLGRGLTRAVEEKRHDGFKEMLGKCRLGKCGGRVARFRSIPPVLSISLEGNLINRGLNWAEPSLS